MLIISVISAIVIPVTRLLKTVKMHYLLGTQTEPMDCHMCGQKESPEGGQGSPPQAVPPQAKPSCHPVDEPRRQFDLYAL